MFNFCHALQFENNYKAPTERKGRGGEAAIFSAYMHESIRKHVNLKAMNHEEA
jgi:hypothetical protein